MADNGKRRTCWTLAVAEVRHAVAHAVAVPRTVLAAMRGWLRAAGTGHHARAAKNSTPKQHGGVDSVRDCATKLGMLGYPCHQMFCKSTTMCTTAGAKQGSATAM